MLHVACQEHMNTKTHAPMKPFDPQSELLINIFYFCTLVIQRSPESGDM